MINNILRTIFSVNIETTRVTISIRSEKHSKCISYRYKPIDKMDPYHNCQIAVGNRHASRTKIAECLRLSWIEDSDFHIDTILIAISDVRGLAER